MNLFDVIIVQPILNLLMAIYAIVPGGDFGISIVIFTIIIRFLLWPLVKKQLHQTKAMRKMQPEQQNVWALKMYILYIVVARMKFLQEKKKYIMQKKRALSLIC